MIVRAGFGNGAIAPIMRRTVQVFFGPGSEFLGQGRDEHCFCSKVFAEHRLAHG
jgi:hypothetical protein